MVAELRKKLLEDWDTDLMTLGYEEAQGFRHWILEKTKLYDGLGMIKEG
ncbi:MAG: hypothetical protein OWU33_13880 [Firmicutes bacterium]|nr:hypothetical protein [Bacillota bacterium]